MMKASFYFMQEHTRLVVIVNLIGQKILIRGHSYQTTLVTFVGKLYLCRRSCKSVLRLTIKVDYIYSGHKCHYKDAMDEAALDGTRSNIARLYSSI